MSRIGQKPIVIPKEVNVEVKEGVIFVEGKKGKLKSWASRKERCTERSKNTT